MTNSLLMRTIYWAILPFVFVYVFVPALFFFLPSTMQHVFFLNFVRFRFVDYYNLEMHGVRARGRNFYLRERDLATTRNTPDGSDAEEPPTIGVWHILPRSLSEKEEQLDEAAMERSMDEDSSAVFIYLHGNSFDRTTQHRCEMYNVLSAMDFHVLSIDYRGYGDSSGRPHEEGLNEDAHRIIEYARKLAPSKDIYVWGHSMGTGVATRLVAELSDAGRAPKALVLESPFNNLRDVVRNHPFSIPLRILPWFDQVIVDPLSRSGLVMSSDERIQRITCPVLVLHAADDHIIPVDLARKLVKSAEQSNRKISYVEFEAEREYMHKYIHRAPELPDILREFVHRGHLQERSRNREVRNGSGDAGTE